MFQVFILLVGIVLMTGLVVLGCVMTLAMPKSRTRDVVRSVLLGLLSALYVLMPADFMPAAVLGPVGGVDDVAVLLMAVKKIKALLHGCEHLEDGILLNSLDPVSTKGGFNEAEHPNCHWLWRVISAAAQATGVSGLCLERRRGLLGRGLPAHLHHGIFEESE